MSEKLAANSDSARPSGLPATPDGYAEPYEFTYPMGVLLIGSGLLGLLSAVVVVGLLSQIHGLELFTFYEVTVEGETTTWTMDLTAIAVPFLVALIVTTVVHELIHGLVFRWYGHTPEYGAVPALGAFYAAVFGEFQNRDDLLRVALAPLLVITAVCVPLLAVPVPIIAITAGFVLILNTAGAVGDLYALWRVGRMPRGTLMYDVDIRHSYVYEPRSR
ncbi:DUF3267 domain-containing protein [Natronorubrum sp. DTA28]|uniref:DUF3267 domain-containing protein n=1 Tax=Natronorubrum sp. DTA28 TaxID=3447019 RepID=UPI003F85B634